MGFTREVSKSCRGAEHTNNCKKKETWVIFLFVFRPTSSQRKTCFRTRTHARRNISEQKQQHGIRPVCANPPKITGTLPRVHKVQRSPGSGHYVSLVSDEALGPTGPVLGTKQKMQKDERKKSKVKERRGSTGFRPAAAAVFERCFSTYCLPAQEMQRGSRACWTRLGCAPQSRSSFCSAIAAATAAAAATARQQRRQQRRQQQQ